MRVIFMGTPDFAVGTLRALIRSRHEVCAVFSQPDKPKGRGKAMQMTPVKEVAAEAGIPVYQPKRIRDAEAVAQVKGLHADVIVVVAFGQIIPKEILEAAPYGCINVHASLLPAYRGAAPIQWAVINGDKEAGVTTMQMDAGLDTGDMLLKAVVPVEKKETGGSLFDKLSSVGAELLLETLEGLEKGSITPQKQGETTTPYAAMLTKEQGKIDWTQDAETIERLIRGLNPWPSAYTSLNGKTLKLWAADAENGVSQESGAQPGTVSVSAAKDALRVSTGKGTLVIRELQLEGKKRMACDAFLRGYPVEPGTILGRQEQ